MSDFDDLEDGMEYCVYCYEEQNDKIGCCGENHFLTGKEIKEYEKPSRPNDIQGLSLQNLAIQGKVYDPPMTDTEQYLLNKEREEEHKSYDY